MGKRWQPEQLSLAIGDSPPQALPRRLKPMTPLPRPAPFDDEDYFFEPWWPGASALLYVEDGAVRLQTEHLADPLAAFPELAVIGRQFGHDGWIVEGTILILDDEGRPDPDLLRRRLAESAAAEYVSEAMGTAAFVASDLLYRDGRAMLAAPFEDRRRRLAKDVPDSATCVVSRGLRGEGLTLGDAVASMGLTDISARLLDGRYRPGMQDESWLKVPVTETPIAPTRPLLTLLQRLPL